MRLKGWSYLRSIQGVVSDCSGIGRILMILCDLDWKESARSVQSRWYIRRTYWTTATHGRPLSNIWGSIIQPLWTRY